MFNSTLKHGKDFKIGTRQPLPDIASVTFRQLTSGVTMESIVSLNCNLFVLFFNFIRIICFQLFPTNGVNLMQVVSVDFHRYLTFYSENYYNVTMEHA